MVVRYWTDVISEDSLAIEFEPNGSIKLASDGWPVRCSSDFNMAFFNNKTPTREDVLQLIKNNAPVAWLRLKEDVINPDVKTDLNSAEKLIGKEDSFEVRFNN
jgi:hypothetical protein